jgi:16S rRNA (guanine1207-N2)-methyltransferase
MLPAQFLLYGAPPPELAPTPTDAIQCSPLHPGAAALEGLADGQAEEAVVLAPPGVVERRYVLAQALRILRTDGRLLALAPKDKGGSRLGKELQALGCEVEETARRHHRICAVRRHTEPEGIAQAIEAGGPRRDDRLGLWTWPGVFSWDRLDPGTAALIQALPAMAGQGADLGCGVGVLSQAALANTGVTRLLCVDRDRRAIECARRNLVDARVETVWADVRKLPEAALDFVIMNPPFHDAGSEDRRLGQAFVQAAARMLRRGGMMYVVANRHLPYEAVLDEAFAAWRPLADMGGYKVLEARR